jgi:hyperosmotically inducible periplasmic protein
MKIHATHVLVAVLLAASGAACSKKEPGEPGNMEKIGQKLDHATEKTGEYLSDGAITTQVKAALALNKSIDAGAISVETTDGVVTLRGTVATDPIKGEAEHIAAGVRGVKSVVNQLVAKS